MHWSELEAAQPGLAELGRERLLVPGVVLVATIRRNGTPQAQPGRAVRDGWGFVAIHALAVSESLGLAARPAHPGPQRRHRPGWRGEFKVRGTARAEDDPDVQFRYSDSVRADLGWTPTPGRFHLFAVSLDDVTFIRYDDATGDQHVAMWPPAREFIRRGDGGTSLREPEPAQDIITAG